MLTKTKQLKKVPNLRFPGFFSEWKEKRLGEVVAIYDGTHQTPKYVKKGVPFYSVEHLTSNNFFDTKFIAEEVFNKENKRVRLEKGDILMTRIGDIGTARMIDWDVKASFYVSLALIKKKKEINSLFLAQYINTSSFQKELWRRTIHVAFPKKINLGEIRECNVSIPKDLEQKKIADFLGSADEWLENLREQKKSLKEYKRGMMQKIFSQEIRFKDESGKNFPEWEEKRLGEVCDKNSSNISSNSLKNNYGKYKIYGATGFLKRISFYKESEKYISIVKDGAGVGRLLLCDPKSSVLGTLDIIRAKKKINIYFLYILLSRINFIKYKTGSTIPHIYYKDYKKEKIEIPSFSEQQKIADFLTLIDNLIELKQQQIDQGEQWKKGLMQGLFV